MAYLKAAVGASSVCLVVEMVVIVTGVVMGDG